MDASSSLPISWGAPSLVLGPDATVPWRAVGVRDPAPLIDPQGNLIIDASGKAVLYFTSNLGEGRGQGVGRAVSGDGGQTWSVEPEEPVLTPSADGWDSGIATTAWVSPVADGYVMFYRGARTAYQDEGIGRAFSHDGIRFERDATPILTARDFADIPHDGRHMMGVLNCVRLFDDRLLITFEATSASHNSDTQIFGAISDDGQVFVPVNDGFPLFSRAQVQTLPARRVANPRILRDDEGGRYVLTFNAQHQWIYWLGQAETKDLSSWTESSGNPLLLPSGFPAEDVFSGRVEGGVDVRGPDGERQLYIMGIPRASKSHEGGGLGVSVPDTQDSICLPNGWLAATGSGSAVTVKDDGGVMLRSSGTEVPVAAYRRVHADFAGGEALAFRLSAGADTRALVIYGTCAGAAFARGGVRVALADGVLYVGNVKRIDESAFETFIERIADSALAQVPVNGQRGAEVTLSQGAEAWSVTVDGRELCTVPCKAVAVKGEPEVLSCYVTGGELALDLRKTAKTTKQKSTLAAGQKKGNLMINRIKALLKGGRAAGRASPAAKAAPQEWTAESFRQQVRQILKTKPPVEQQRLLRAALVSDQFAFLDAGQELYGQRFVYNLLRLGSNELASVADRIGQDCYGLLDVERDDPVVLDIGAHIGIFGVFAKAERPNSRVIVLEADPENVVYLRRNMEPFDDVEVVHAALLDTEEDLTLFRSKRIDWRSSLRVVEDFETRVKAEEDEFEPLQTLRTQTLDSLAERLQLERLDLLKIAVGGQIEPRVLRSGLKTLERFRPRIGMYVYAENQAEILDILTPLGYEMRPSKWQGGEHMKNFVPVSTESQ